MRSKVRKDIDQRIKEMDEKSKKKKGTLRKRGR
jgi:hypothetical protein